MGVRQYLSVIALEIALLNVVNVTKLVLNVTVDVITKGLVQIKNNLLFPFFVLRNWPPAARIILCA